MSSRQDNIRWLEEAIKEAGLQTSAGHVPFPIAVKIGLKLGVQRETAEDYVRVIASSGSFKTNGYTFIVSPTTNGSSIIKKEKGSFDRIEDKLTELVSITTRILESLEKK